MPITKQIKDASSLLGQSIKALANLQNPEVTKALADLEEANRMLTGVLKVVAGEKSLNKDKSQLHNIADKLSNCLIFKFRTLPIESIVKGLIELHDKLGDENLNLVDFRNSMIGSILQGRRENLGSLPEDLVKNGCLERVRTEQGLRYRLTDEFKDAVTKYKLER